MGVLAAGTAVLHVVMATIKYPEEAELIPALVVAAGLVAAALLGAAVWRAQRLHAWTAWVSWLSAVLLLGAGAWGHEQLESPYAWLLVLPAFWLGRRGRVGETLTFVAAAGIVIAMLGAAGEADEIWRGVLLWAVIAGICASELGGARRVTRRQAELEESQRRLARALGDVAAAREAERHMLAGQLHDFPLQRMIAARMGVRRLLRRNDEATRSCLDEVNQGLGESIAWMRSIMNGIEPDSLVEVGIADALREHGRTIEANYDVRVRIEQRGAAELGGERRLATYRMVAEAMTNAARHARARTICVALDADADELQVVVADDGVGLHKHMHLVDELPSEAGTGLTLIAQHVSDAGGRLTITSTPGTGTRLECRLPIAAEPPARTRAWEDVA